MNEELYMAEASRMKNNAETEVFLDRLRGAAEKREDVTLFGVRYTTLPLGADGAPLGIGDKVDSDVYPSGTVVGVRWEETHNGVHAFISVLSEGWVAPTWYSPKCFRRRRHPEQTVEDVLREFTRTILNQKVCCREQNIAKYAKRLRLAEVDE